MAGGGVSGGRTNGTMVILSVVGENAAKQNDEIESALSTSEISLGMNSGVVE